MIHIMSTLNHLYKNIARYSIGAGISPVNVQKQEAGMPQNLSFDTGASNVPAPKKTITPRWMLHIQIVEVVLNEEACQQAQQGEILGVELMVD